MIIIILGRDRERDHDCDEQITSKAGLRALFIEGGFSPAMADYFSQDPLPEFPLCGQCARGFLTWIRAQHPAFFDIINLDKLGEMFP